MFSIAEKTAIEIGQVFSIEESDQLGQKPSLSRRRSQMVSSFQLDISKW